MHFDIFTTTSCGYCRMAKALITERGHSYTEKIIGQDLTKDEFFAKMSSINGTKSVPQVFLKDEYIGGYEKLQQFYEDVTHNFGDQAL